MGPLLGQQHAGLNHAVRANRVEAFPQNRAPTKISANKFFIQISFEQSVVFFLSKPINRDLEKRVWPDGQIASSTFGRFRKWKFTQQQKIDTSRLSIMQ